jgi:iron complex transport system substrate-binding protein
MEERVKTILAGVVAGALLLAACGDDDDAATTEPTAGVETTLPATTAAPASTAAPGTTAAEDLPSRIVSLSPTHTEMLFAIGAGDQVVAVDSLSTFPEEAAAVVTDLSAYEPNVEAIAGYEPDLVITDGTNPDLLAQLDSLGIAHWEGSAPAVISGVYDQIEQLGALTGHIGEAAELVGQMEADIDEILAGLPPLETPLSMYHELDDTYFSVTSDTFIGQVYNLAGLRNIADEAEGAGGGYPQLNAEFIISTNPDLIFLADAQCCGQTADVVSARPGWDAISAVANGAIVELDEDIASRWGPRVVDLLRTVSDAVHQVAISG